MPDRSLNTALAGACASLLLAAQPATAAGIESFDLLPERIETPSAFAGMAQEQKSKLDAADEAFQNSSTLKELLARSEANKAKNKKDIQNKYCYRQAELGVGDCGGLRYIPGLTDSGKQKTPQWLADLLGVDTSAQEDMSGGKTLKQLIEGAGN